MYNAWNEFLKKNGGKGMSMAQLQKYYKTEKSKNIKKSKTVKKYKRSSVKKTNLERCLSGSTREKICKGHLSKKISINMREYKKGKYSSPTQAIAVSYNQVKKKYSKCSPCFNRK